MANMWAATVFQGGIRMYIYELINNPDFSFNVPFRIVSHLEDERDVTVFDSTVSGDIHFDLMMRPISSIKAGKDGVLEIKYLAY